MCCSVSCFKGIVSGWVSIWAKKAFALFDQRPELKDFREPVSEVHYQFTNPQLPKNLRIPPACPILAVFDGYTEFLQLIADLVGERP
jgi:hypothetical protein